MNGDRPGMDGDRKKAAALRFIFKDKMSEIALERFKLKLI